MKDMVNSLGLAFTIIGCILLGLAIGYCIDALLNSSPTFMIFGIILGTLSSFWVLYGMAKRK